MPRSKNQKHHHWDIDDPHELLAEARRKVLVFKALHNLTQPEAVAQLLDAGYAQLVSAPSPEAGRAQLRGNGDRDEHSGSAKRRTTGSKAA